MPAAKLSSPDSLMTVLVKAAGGVKEGESAVVTRARVDAGQGGDAKGVSAGQFLRTLQSSTRQNLAK
jgi:hypothetical protein